MLMQDMLLILKSTSSRTFYQYLQLRKKMYISLWQHFNRSSLIVNLSTMYLNYNDGQLMFFFSTP